MSSNIEKAESAKQAAIARWKVEDEPANYNQWLSRAKEVGEILTIDAVERDQKGETPFKEIALLKAAGLVNLLGPKKYGGGEQSWELAYKIVFEISKSDSSIGHLLGNHYHWWWTPQFLGTEPQNDKWVKIFTENDSFLGGAVNARNADVTIEEDGNELVFNGRKFFSTGSVVGDYLILEGVLPNEKHVLAFVPGSDPGLTYLHDWDAIGQRLTESGGVAIKNVRVKWEDALGYNSSGENVINDVYSTVNLPTVQLVFASVYLGVAFGALATAAGYTREHTRPWPYGGENKERGVDEWYIREGYGILAAKNWGAEALHKEAVKLVSDALHASRGSLFERTRGEIAVKVAAVKVLATEAALEITTKIFELTGSRSGLRKYGLDRFWRNVRLHSLHDPVAYKKREVGTFFLLDEVPTPSWYT